MQAEVPVNPPPSNNSKRAFAPETEQVRSSVYLALGSLASRLLGLARELTITRLFGQTGLVSAFTVASQIPIMVYDLIVGGYISAAFIPVLSSWQRRDESRDFYALVNSLLLFFGLVLLLISSSLLAVAPALTRFMAQGLEQFDPDLLDTTTRMVKYMTPVLWLTGMSGLLNATLYALRRFAWPALANALFNAGVVLVSPFLVQEYGVFSLVIGLWCGVGLQTLLLAFDLGRGGFRGVRSVWHPGMREILIRYLPIVLGQFFSYFQTVMDRRLASGTGVSSIAWMRTGTTLQQLPLGLISVSVGLATLPILSRTFNSGSFNEYRSYLVKGLSYMVLILTPVLIFMGVLSEPIIRILFLRGQFTPTDVSAVLPATRIYLVGAFFAAMDYLLNNAFYARKNTLLPSLVGVGSVVLYFIAAFSLVGPFNYLGLVWADSIKHGGHMLAMAILVSHYVFGGWRNLLRILGPTLVRTASAAVMAASATLGFYLLLRELFPPFFWHDVGVVVFCSSVGFGFYGMTLFAWGHPEFREALRILPGLFAKKEPEDTDALPPSSMN